MPIFSASPKAGRSVARSVMSSRSRYAAVTIAKSTCGDEASWWGLLVSIRQLQPARFGSKVH
jgi:hypothetical protein